MHDMPEDPNSTAIAQSIVAMAGHLSLRVVAKGVQTAEQARFLAQQGNVVMSGFHFHRPMPLVDVVERLGAVAPFQSSPESDIAAPPQSADELGHTTTGPAQSELA